MDSFVAYRSRTKLALLLAGALAFVVAGLWFVGTFGPVHLTSRSGRPLSPQASFVKGWSIGGPAILFFGPCALMILKMMLGSGELLRIDANGILWARWSGAVIPWDEIVDVRESTGGRVQFICLTLRHPDRYPGRGLLGLLGKSNKTLTGADIAITTGETNHSFAETMKAISCFRQAHASILASPASVVAKEAFGRRR